MIDRCEVFLEEKSEKKLKILENRFNLGQFSVAPMIDWTDRHCRYFLRLMTKHSILYTEMITTGAILRGSQVRHLDFHLAEKPLVLQLGGSDPKALAQCARVGEEYGYDAVNLNIGCPSSRVQSGRFGACLMKDPLLVAECILAMQSAVKIPVTVKTRTGVDEQDSYENLAEFIKTVSSAGCKTFIIHARKAWLKGLSPKENREIPPLNYETVEKLQNDFSGLHFILNGGIHTLDQAKVLLKTFSGVMLGRVVMHSPYILSKVDQEIFGVRQTEVLSREEIIDSYKNYAREQHSQGVPLSVLLRPLMGMYQGEAGARQWRQNVASRKIQI